MKNPSKTLTRNHNKTIFLILLLLPFLYIYRVKAQSNLLENVKSNPQEAISLCNQFKALNKDGISTSSQSAIETIAAQQNLNKTDAEILIIYVKGLHCPNLD